MMGLLARASAVPSPYTVPPSQKFDGNDGSWSTFKISVGTPGQDFRVLPSTKSGVTNVIVPDGCQPEDPSNCRQLRGIEIFNSAQNIGFQVNASASWSTIGQYDVDIEEALGLNSRALFGFDKVALGAAAGTNVLSLDRQVVGGMAMLDYFLGFLPLGQADASFASSSQSIDSFLYQMRNKTMIPSFSYAYTAGAKYRLKGGVFGNLILGGYDSTRFKPNDNDFSFTFSQNPSKLLGVGVESITATNSLKGTYSLSSGAHLSVIDSTVPHLWLPRAICDQFEQAFGLTYDSKQDLYLVNDTIHQQLLSNNPTITFKLVNTPGSSTNYTNIQLPYGAFDLQASYPFYQNATNYFPIRRAQNDTQYVLGRTLLQEAYLIVDYERANFTVAQAVFPDPLPAAKVVTIYSKTDSPNTNGGSGLATGAIVGIAVGAAILAFIAIFAVFIFRRRRAKKLPYELANSQVSDTASGRHFDASAAPMKYQGPSELSGTPLTELASPAATPHYPSDQKSAISINEMPAELHAESRTPVTPRWEEVHMPLRPPRTPNDDAISNGSRSVSQLPSDDGYHSGGDPRSAVSPLTGQFGQIPSFHR